MTTARKIGMEENEPMTLSHAAPACADQIADPIELAPRINGFHLEPRCRVCRNDQLRTKVNEMLAAGASYAYIVRALAGDNDKLDPRDRVTIDSVRNHCERHFPVQQTARAVYRDILERRAQENQIDFVKGVATALLPVTFFEVAMNKAFQTLVDDHTEVDQREKGTNVLELKVALDQIGQAVRAVVPEEMWDEIIEKLEELEDQHPEALDVGMDSFDSDDDEPFDPTEFIDEDDDEF